VVDEPQRAPRLDHSVEIGAEHAGPADLGGEGRRLQAELDGQPEHVEIGEVQDLAVEVEPPRGVYAGGEEEAGEQEEVGHAERLREGDDVGHPASLARHLLDAERGVHHHHEKDAKSLGDIDPVDPFVHRRRSSAHLRPRLLMCSAVPPVAAQLKKR
jgi:hypothetical protein